MIVLKLIYDGNNLAYRCNSVNELYTKQGERVSAIFGTLKSIRSDIESLEKITGETVEEVVFAWDYGKSERRLTLHPEYKANRKKDKTEDDALWYEEFLDQANFLHENLPHLGVKSLKIKGWEADDLIYGLCKLMSGDVVVVSTDEDMLQLVNHKTTIYSPIKKIFINNQNFHATVGVPLAGFLTYKIMKGDPSDNIRGIDGIGEKTGKDLVNKYVNMRGILSNKSTLMKSKRFAKIFTPEGLQVLDRNHKLINLAYVDFSDIEPEIQEIVNSCPEYNEKKVMEMLKSKQFISILTDYRKWSKPFQTLNASSGG